MTLHDRLEMARWMYRGLGREQYGHTNGPLIQELLVFEAEVLWLENERRKRALNNAPPWSSSDDDDDVQVTTADSAMATADGTADGATADGVTAAMSETKTTVDT